MPDMHDRTVACRQSWTGCIHPDKSLLRHLVMLTYQNRRSRSVKTEAAVTRLSSSASQTQQTVQTLNEQLLLQLPTLISIRKEQSQVNAGMKQIQDMLLSTEQDALIAHPTSDKNSVSVAVNFDQGRRNRCPASCGETTWSLLSCCFQILTGVLQHALATKRNRHGKHNQCLVPSYSTVKCVNKSRVRIASAISHDVAVNTHSCGWRICFLDGSSRE